MGRSIAKEAEPYLRRIENLHADIDEIANEARERIAMRREDIREVYAEAKTKDVNTKALRGLVKFRKLEFKKEKIYATMGSDDASIYEALIETLGELGEAAAKRAGVTIIACRDDAAATN